MEIPSLRPLPRSRSRQSRQGTRPPSWGAMSPPCCGPSCIALPGSAAAWQRLTWSGYPTSPPSRLLSEPPLLPLWSPTHHRGVTLQGPRMGAHLLHTWGKDQEERTAVGQCLVWLLFQSWFLHKARERPGRGQLSSADREVYMAACGGCGPLPTQAWPTHGHMWVSTPLPRTQASPVQLTTLSFYVTCDMSDGSQPCAPQALERTWPPVHSTHWSLD